MVKRIDPKDVPIEKGSGYPAPFGAECATRLRQRLGNAAGLADFGVNLLRLPPGCWSSQRHWHSAEDEFVFVRDGHHLQNRSDRDVVLLEMGSRRPADDEGDYPDIDLKFLKGDIYVRKDGRSFSEE